MPRKARYIRQREACPRCGRRYETPWDTRQYNQRASGSFRFLSAVRRWPEQHELFEREEHRRLHDARAERGERAREGSDAAFRHRGDDLALHPSGKENEREENRKIHREPRAGTLAAKRCFHVDKIAVDVCKTVCQQERQHISPCDNAVHHILRAVREKRVGTEYAAQQRRQRRDNTVERERQEIGEQKLQDRHRETYKIEFHKLPERASLPCGKALVQPLPCVHGETVTPTRPLQNHLKQV